MKLVFRSIIPLLWLFVLIPSISKAQEWEYSISIGTSGYMGEYNQDKIFKFNSVAGAIGAKYNFNPNWGVRGDLSMSEIKGNGKHSKDPELVDRVFKKTLKELSISSEFNFFKFVPNTKRATYTPYVNAGVGVILFDPKEQHGKAGKHIIRPTLLYGAGFKYNLKSSLSLQGELIYRTAFTDWLDSLASPQEFELNEYEPARTDSYMTFQIGLTYTFFKQGCPTW